MVELSRRLFLFGSAAALAAAAVPVALAESVIAPPLFTPCPTLSPYLRREVFGIIVYFDHGGVDEVASIEVGRHGSDNVLMQLGMNVRSTYYWRAMPTGQIIVPANNPLRLSVLTARALGQVQLECLDTVDDGPPVEVMEIHRFPSRGKPVEPAYMYPDNSLKARRQREEGRKRAAEAAALADEEGADIDWAPAGTLPTLPWR